VADSQSAGRCRHKIIWESPSNLGLWLSFVWFSKVTWAQMPQSTLVLAVAVKEAIKEACDLDLGIKWPNDLLGGGKKCAGLLVETAPKSPQKALVLGIGINLSQRCRDFPISLRDTATSLGMLSGNFNLSRTKLTFSLAYRIKYWFEKWELEGFTEVRRAWLKDNLTLGREIVVDNGLPLLAIDLDQSGALVAKTTNDQIVTFNTGEIRFV
jgi:BirA family biotin operon repressor/biotin-[acetyl-CoA-carboxylase] ligase